MFSQSLNTNSPVYLTFEGTVNDWIDEFENEYSSMISNRDSLSDSNSTFSISWHFSKEKEKIWTTRLKLLMKKKGYTQESFLKEYKEKYV